ncbi:helicase-associated domain-containing protein [Corynebacterium lowii]|uniref:Helicase XPB/Ssl2 N-terminal domain-containing protein n=1 Tax=Corynebacterium lowii TaxID=1544413 RepID=A0A0Q0U2G2_9CORY|nr:helicase-associated domain-containing protein [Corynebacterium lowii]KQB86055.1 hypothetical protein Clow_01799 [Corynebacterium lowii]MDP9850514.1 hypothetical protein [Corynebacterium lowii]
MPHSYQSWLRELSPERLATLLRLRPDTALPIPPTLASLATRLRIRSSVAQALRRLNAADLAVAEAAAGLGAEFEPVPRARIIAALPDLPAEESLRTLENFGLLYSDGDGNGNDGGEHVMLLKEVFASLPQDWRLLGDTPLSEEEIHQRLKQIEPKYRTMLDTLATSAGMGLTRDEYLVDTQLVIRVDENTVRLPLSVRRALRGLSPAHVPLAALPGRSLSDAADAPTRTAPTASSLRAIDEAGVASGLDAVRIFAQLIAALGERPLPLLRSGGIGVRETRRLARTLDIEVEQAKRVICLAQAAGLVATGEPEPLPEEDHSYLAPTTLADEWLAAPPARRLEIAVAGWRGSRWRYWDSEKLLEQEEPRLPALRQAVLAPYLVGPVALSEREANANMIFLAPVATSGVSPELIAHLRAEAQWIGALAEGAATVVLRGDSPLADFVPQAVNQVILQADMTALAPGPLEHQIEAELSLMAHLESPGLASVYRFTEESLARAFDAGRSSQDILSFLASHSLGPVPQGLEYLIGDVGKQHGSLRGGPALCYLRCDDPATLSAAVHASSSLRALAPTVAIAEAPLAVVMAELREAGFHPAAEDSSGLSIDIRPEPARISPSGTTRRVRTTHTQRPELTEQRMEQIVAALRGAEEEEQSPAEDHATLLTAASRGRRTVVLGYVDGNGKAVRRRIRPLRITAGQVDALDADTGTAHRFGLHRVTSVELVP